MNNTPRRQQGQALAFATVTLAVVLLSMLVMLSSGQLTTEKTRLQNTADAAAYSGALVLARDYNFSAYTNRAMVANQVAIAQWVGLTSWARHNNDAFNGLLSSWFVCVELITGMPPTIAPFSWCGKWARYGRSARSILREEEAIARPSITAINRLTGVLSDAQKNYHRFTMATVNLTMQNVVHENDNDARLSISPVSAGFVATTINNQNNFSRTYSTRADLRPFADVTHRSLDAFSGRNTAQRAGIVPLQPYHDGMRKSYPYGAGILSFSDIYTGGTELSADFKSWTAVDVSSTVGIRVQNHIQCVWIFGCYPVPYWYDHIPFTHVLGHAGAVAGRGSVGLANFNNANYSRGITSYGNSMLINAAPTALQIFFPNGGRIGSYDGLRPYQELRQASGNTSRNFPSVLIEVEKEAHAIKTTSNEMTGDAVGDAQLGAQTIPLKLSDRFASRTMRVVSGAEAYFARPEERSDGKVEWPSLFNPYWQARLKDTTREAVLSGALQ